MSDDAPPVYDRHGRMQYHPAFHDRHGQPWTTTDQQFLIDHYDLLGPEQVSFALGRTIHTVMTRAYELRRDGLMPKPAKRGWSRRSQPPKEED